jgi:hypothetical protein
VYDPPAVRTTCASVGVGIASARSGWSALSRAGPSVSSLATLTIGAARLATARSHTRDISPDAPADTVVLNTERHHEAPHADGYHAAAMHRGAGGHGGGHAGH